MAINDRVTLDLGTVRSGFREGFTVTVSDVAGELTDKKRTTEWLERQKRWPKSLDEVTAGEHWDVYRAMSDSDLRMCKNLGIDRDLGAPPRWRSCGSSPSRLNVTSGPRSTPIPNGVARFRGNSRLNYRK